MKAVAAIRYGAPETYVVTDVPVPAAGPGQIQVRIAAASINPADVRLPSGAYRDVAPLVFPHVLGNDFAGTVTAAGPGVRDYRVGDEVFGQSVPRVLRALVSPTRPSLGTGSLAEYAVFEADTPLIAHRPAGLPADRAAAVPTVGLTVLALLGTAAVRPGETALVVGATGGVGTALVPLLAEAGARVIATATPADAELLRTLGADTTIGYAESEYPSGVDVAFNLTRPGDGLGATAGALRTGGRLLTITEPIAGRPRDDVEARFVLDLDAAFGGMNEVADLVVAGRLPVTIGRRYDFADGPRACVDFARRHTTGKLVVSTFRTAPAV
ncbi:NADP-dependent oxidoreductase [Cryptosporangium arvum]|uniref:NADP-dependent oxidoreductase n=1 Tax=Cryptosporangium arvum TaxID=80871 RepID=UPI0004B85B38|nr:NADP-dependent oxidoreductase [Cryptosporangium arvum]